MGGAPLPAAYTIHDLDRQAHIQSPAVAPGDLVVLKPNLICAANWDHPGRWEEVVTHPSVIRAVLDEVLTALDGTGRVVICDGPQTDSDFDLLLARTGLGDLIARYRAEGHPVELLDLRRERWIAEGGVTKQKLPLPGDPSGYVRVDLAAEYGGTAGLVTLEDLLEEIFGEVSDPFDHVSPEFQTQPDGSIWIDGMTLIEDVNAHLGLDLEDPNYYTIAGYMLGQLGRMARVGDSVVIGERRQRVESMDGLRIARLSLLPATPREAWGLRPRSKEQRFALDLLLDPEISIVALDGPAGTGKSLLAIAAGLEQVVESGAYQRLSVFRPLVPVGRKDIGFLPGDLATKTQPYFSAIFDDRQGGHGLR